MKRRSPLLSHLPWAAAALLHLALGFCLFTNNSPDDTHITYAAARNLLLHGKVTNYNGDPIEQSSSLAHVLLTALGAWISRAPVPTVGHVIPILFGVACLPLAQELARRVAPRATVAAPFFVATIPTFLFWSFGGLEVTIFAFATLWTCLAVSSYLRRRTEKKLLVAGAAMFLLVASRPEGPILLLASTACLAGIAALRARAAPGSAGQAQAANEASGAGWDAWKTALAPELEVLVVALVASAAITLVHLRLGGHVLPNSARAKTHPIALGAGWSYLWHFIGWKWAWAVVAFGVGCWEIARRAPHVTRARGSAEQVTALFGAGNLAFTLLVGGDWMWGGRFLADGAPVLGLVALAGACTVLAHPAIKPAVGRLAEGPLLALALVLANMPSLMFIVEGGRAGRPFWLAEKMNRMVRERYPDAPYDWIELACAHNLRDVPMAEALRDILNRIADSGGPQPIVVASRQAGFTAYHALSESHARTHFVDMDNLATDDYLTCAGNLLRHTDHGAMLTYQMLMNPPPKLARRCKVVRPHVIFDVSRQTDNSELTRGGYTFVFIQRGVPGAAKWWIGRTAAYIAVDTELAEKAGLEPVTIDAFDYQWADISRVLFGRNEGE